MTMLGSLSYILQGLALSWSRFRTAAGPAWEAPFVIWHLKMVSSFFLELMRELGLSFTLSDLSQMRKACCVLFFEWYFINYETTPRQLLSVLFLNFCSHGGYGVTRSWVKV